MSVISKLIPCASAIAFVTAGAPVASAQQVSSQSNQPSMPTAASPGANWPVSEKLEEIIVTGSSIRGVPPTGSNLLSISSEDIKTLGAATTPDLLASMPQLNSFNTAPKASRDGF